MNRCFVDTGAWVALADRSDTFHADLARRFRLLLDKRIHLVTSDYVFDETITLVRRRVGHASAVEIGRRMMESAYLEMVSVDADTRAKAWEWFAKYADAALSFTDCTSFALMRRLELTHALSMDKHFRMAGFLLFPEDG